MYMDCCWLQVFQFGLHGQCQTSLLWNSLLKPFRCFTSQFGSNSCCIPTFQLARQVRLNSCCHFLLCEPTSLVSFRHDFRLQSFMFFGALASVQLRSRPTQSLFLAGWVVAVPRAQPAIHKGISAGVQWDSKFLEYNMLVWKLRNIFFSRVGCGVLCALQYTISACWCPSPPLRGMYVRLHHLRQKMWSSLERLSQPFHVHFSSSGMHLHVHFDGGSCCDSAS